MTAYELKFSSASELGKILALYSKISSEFMISFLPTSIMLLSGLETNVYYKAMVEVPYENMPNIGYVNPDIKLEGSTIRISSIEPPINSTASNGTVKLWAGIDEYKIMMNIKHIKGYVLSNTFNVIEVFSGVIQSPFTDKDSVMITTIPNNWLLEILKPITTKTQWYFSCNMDGVIFIFPDRVVSYPEGINVEYQEDKMKVMDNRVVTIFEKVATCNKQGITKVRMIGSECWFVIMLGDWGQCTVKMGEDINIDYVDYDDNQNETEH